MEGLQSKGAEESAREEFRLKQADGCEKKNRRWRICGPHEVKEQVCQDKDMSGQGQRFMREALGNDWAQSVAS